MELEDRLSLESYQQNLNFSSTPTGRGESYTKGISWFLCHANGSDDRFEKDHKIIICILKASFFLNFMCFLVNQDVCGHTAWKDHLSGG